MGAALIFDDMSQLPALIAQRLGGIERDSESLS